MPAKAGPEMEIAFIRSATPNFVDQYQYPSVEMRRVPSAQVLKRFYMDELEAFETPDEGLAPDEYEDEGEPSGFPRSRPAARAAAGGSPDPTFEMMQRSSSVWSGSGMFAGRAPGSAAPRASSSDPVGSAGRPAHVAPSGLWTGGPLRGGGIDDGGARGLRGMGSPAAQPQEAWTPAGGTSEQQMIMMMVETFVRQNVAGKAHRQMPMTKSRVCQGPDAGRRHYINEVRLRTSVKDGDAWQLWRFTEKLNWGRMVGMMSIHHHPHHCLALSPNGRRRQGEARMTQPLRAVWQSALNRGNWEKAALLPPSEDQVDGEGK
jgi:hypothetical protein